MKTDIISILGWVIPGVCLAASAGVLYNRHQALGAAFVALDSANHALDLANQEKAAVDLQPAARRFAAAEQNKMEETLFLTDIRQRARASGVVISAWSSIASPASTNKPTATPAASTTPAAPAPPADALSNITKVVSNLSLSGPYPALRNFVGGLASSDRLFTISNVNWRRSKESTDLTVTITRFVEPAKPGSTVSNNSPTKPAETVKPQSIVGNSDAPVRTAEKS